MAPGYGPGSSSSTGAALTAAAPLAASCALVELYFSYHESRVTLARIQQEQARGAAVRIEQFVRDVERQMAAAVQAARVTGADEERRLEYIRLLGLHEIKGFAEPIAVCDVRGLG